MNIPHPLEIDRDALAEAGFQLDFSPRERGTMDEVLNCPLSWVPLAPYAPHLIRIPAQAIPLTCPELRGNIIGNEGDSQIIEVTEVYLPEEVPALTGPGTILHLDITNRDTPERAGVPEPIIGYVNSNLTAFALCHLAWQQTVLASWERGVTTYAANSPAASMTDIADSFTARVTAIDGPSPYWEDKAFALDDMGISPGSNWMTTWLSMG